jgi:hypothetical protein
MVLLLFLVLVIACLVAPWLGADTSDTRTERAHPKQGWYPRLREPLA